MARYDEILCEKASKHTTTTIEKEMRDFYKNVDLRMSENVVKIDRLELVQEILKEVDKECAQELQKFEDKF